MKRQKRSHKGPGWAKCRRSKIDEMIAVELRPHFEDNPPIVV